MERKIKCAGYVRVSSKDQVEGESLNTQRESIKKYAEQQGMHLTGIYADEGISGGNVKDRHALLRCLNDAQDGRFKVLIVHRLSRFGRNAKELLENHFELKQAGIELRSISEGIDFGTRYGEAMLGMLSIIAQLERDILTEQMFENRVARAKRGVPTAGTMPFGRRFNRETNEWTLDANAAKAIQEAADRYLAGEKLRLIAVDIGNKYGIKMTYGNLVRIFHNSAGDKWTVTYKGQEPIIYDIPRILSDDVIKRVKERMEFNFKINRTDTPGEYLLSGFIRCEKCGYTLTGQKSVKKNYHYYRHNPSVKCKAFNSIPQERIEHAVMHTILENTYDVPAFERAIAQSMPDENMIDNLKQSIKDKEKQLSHTEQELTKLVDFALAGTLSTETIKDKEASLISTKNKLAEELENLRIELKNLPDVAMLKREAAFIRRSILEQLSGEERMKNATFEQKRRLLHWLFDGKDENGTPYGIYITKDGQGRDTVINYLIYGRFMVGLRTLKGDNINFVTEEPQENYKTFSGGVDI